MDRLSVRAFWLHYFTATHRVSPRWLLCLSAARRLQMLDELMQWDITMR